MIAEADSAGRTLREVFNYLRLTGLAAKREIAQEVDLSLPTVQKYLSLLMEEGLVLEGGSLPSRGGRSPLAYQVNGNSRFAVGVDITKDGITSLILNLHREVLFSSSIEAPFERTDEYFAMVCRSVDETIRRSEVDRSRVLGAGFGMPGLVNAQMSAVTYGKVIDNEGLTSEDFERHLGLPARVLHDVDAAALAEFWPQGSLDNAVYLNISRTLGGSVLINGAGYRGDGAFAGDIGHMSLHPEGLLCYCGNRGCADPYCSTAVLSRHSHGSLTEFFTALAQNDSNTRKVWDHYLADLSRAIHNVHVLFGCTIIVGGALGNHVGPFLEEVRQAVHQLSFYDPTPDEYVFASEYTNEPVATGSALCFTEEFCLSLGNGAEDRRVS